MRRKETSPNDKFRANIITNSVALEFGVAPFDVPVRDGHKHGRGSPHVIMARQVCLYLCHTVFQMNMARIGRVYRRHPTTARHACNVVELNRDDPVFDARIRRLEKFLGAAPAPLDCR